MNDFFHFFQIDKNSFFYLFSTATQTIATLLGLMVAIFLYLIDALLRECKQLSNMLTKIRTNNPLGIFIGSAQEAMVLADEFMKTTSMDQNTKSNMESTILDLKTASGRVDKLKEIPRLFGFILTSIVTFMIAIPFSNEIANETASAVLALISSLAMIISVAWALLLSFRQMLPGAKN